jgi:radical SAM protein with 4Fe4S-binding SPASM domain
MAGIHLAVSCHMIGGISDMRNLLAKQTGKRLWNNARVLSSYHASRLSGKPSINGLPISLSIEPTTSCNLRCPECPSGLRSFTRPTGMLEAGLFQRVIDELSPTLTYLTFYFQGEPFLNASFLEMVSYAASKGIYTSTSTNAHYLREDQARKTVASGLDRLIISIDGTTQETYEAYRVGGELAKVVEGARNIIRFKKELRSFTPQVIFQFLVVKPNEHQIDDLHELASSVGVDKVVLKTAQIYDYENGSDLIPVNERFSRYRKNNSGKYEIKNELLNHCWKMWNSCVITWDGKVVPCCFDKDAKYVLGNLEQNTFREIWFGEKYNDFRRTLLRSRKEIDICRNCTEGTKVWA